MTQALRMLNMPNAKFLVKVTEKGRTNSGDDKVEFYLSPNLGEELLPLKSSASGGEVARVLLSIKLLMRDKSYIPTLIFDEIDANIGGETALLVAENLKQLSKNHQVMLVTHFPQVAHAATHHLQIEKVEVDGRTLTKVNAIEGIERKRELQRMVGGKQKAIKTQPV